MRQPRIVAVPPIGPPGFVTLIRGTDFPPGVPVRCIHGTADEDVPLSQSQAYVAAASGAGGDATLTVIDGGDHSVLIDPASDAWRQTLELLDGL